ncbi:YHYH protein [Maribacter sp. Asnod1-A12]|uniref:YHYH protein n=1 Tax=Maribacter sp. Asnod1-A12 TaxID=3160576 RepID=UPI00386BF0CD
MINLKYLVVLLFTGLLISCSSDDTDITDSTDDMDTIDTTDDTSSTDDDSSESTDYIIQESLLNSASLISFEIVTSQLENGTTADCYKIVFSSNPDNIAKGPFCPETADDIAGMSFYDGATDPGLRVWEKALLDDIENDGYDIVDDDGTVHVDDFSGSTSGNPDTYSYCLDGLDDDSIEITFLIPVNPVIADQVNDIGEIELVGLSVDGIPINGDPPSAINGPAMFNNGNSGTITVVNIPSLDPCGGHNDPAGYYHWHMIPEVINQVLVANDIDQIECTNVEQTTDMVLSGFAKDGFPIYAYATEPDGLDDCGGITAVTSEYPDGIYHYVASTTTASNIPKCLVGVAALNSYVAN